MMIGEALALTPNSEGFKLTRAQEYSLNRLLAAYDIRIRN